MLKWSPKSPRRALSAKNPPQLADPSVTFLTHEDFLSDIRCSSQRFRIVGLNSLAEARSST